MKILGLIPARGGSKRLPNKNVKLLGELPLIAWSIRAALASKVCADVVVSTDDPLIAEISKQHGATVPGLRPAELATDTATSVDVAIHALDAYEAAHGSIDGLMLLQPTSPFRGEGTIQQAVALFESNGRRPVVGVGQAEPHPAWSFYLKQNTLVPILGWDGFKHRSQDLSPAYALNGAMYVVSPETLRSRRTFITDDACPLIMTSPAESLDIDMEWDWMIAEAVLRQR